MLDDRSKQIRRDIIKLSKANGGYHFGGCFSCVEIMISLYDYVLTDLDTFILSKGHACWTQYVFLREKGLEPKLEGHSSRDIHNGIICTTGSMGHGMPTAVGIALAKKLKADEGRVFVLVGDGECQEGTTWESLLIASQLQLDNLTVIIDYNEIQGSGRTSDVLSIEGIDIVASAIGWLAYKVDGHNIEGIIKTIKDSDYNKYPKLVIANTIKGKGVSFMEDVPKWHACWLDDEMEKKAMEELK